MTADGIVSRFDRDYYQAWYAWEPFYSMAARDLRFYLGDQWDEQEKRKLYEEGRSSYVFNRIRPVINFATGYQRQRRNISVVVPVEDGDQKTADQMTKVIMHVMNYGRGYKAISDAFSGACKTGWNLLTVWKDYRDDPVDGDIFFSREPYSAFITDAYFTNLDFSDCGYIMRRKYLSPEMVSSLLPGHEKEVSDLAKVGWERDDKFTWMPYQIQPAGRELMAYNEYIVQEWEDKKCLVDMKTGQWREWPGDEKSLRQYVAAFPDMEIMTKPTRIINKHIIVNNHTIKTIKNPDDQNEYTSVPFVITFEPESDNWGLKVQSLIRPIVDPQRETNRRRSQMVDLLDSQINSGWLADENSVVNPRSLFQSSQGKVIWRREDARPGAIEKIAPGQIPPGNFQLQELFDKDIKEISGLNDAAFGLMESANESGVIQMLKQGAAIANAQEVFDNLRFAQEQVTKKVIKMIQTWSPQKIARILGEEPTQEFFDKDLVKYDIVITEGIDTPTQKQMYFRQLVDMKNLGVPVSAEMLSDAAPIQGKSKYNEMLKAQEEAQAKAQQEQQQLQNMLLDSQQKQAHAKALADVAMAKERFSRAVSNMGLEDERASKAVENRSQSILNRMKAIKELQEMDDNRIAMFLNLFMKLEDQNKKKEDEIKIDDVAVAESSVRQPLNQGGLNESKGL